MLLCTSSKRDPDGSLIFLANKEGLPLKEFLAKYNISDNFVDRWTASQANGVQKALLDSHIEILQSSLRQFSNVFGGDRDPEKFCPDEETLEMLAKGIKLTA